MSDDDDTDPQETAIAPQRGGQMQRRDFSGTSLALSNPATEMLVAKARADTEARWIMAMRQPRHPDTVRTALIAECKRPEFAAVAIYRRPVGSKKNEQTGQWEQQFVEGLSIRFAEVAARCMGNLQPDVNTIYDDDKQRVVRVTVTDFETNVTWSRDLTIAKTVERRQLKKGQRPLGERLNSYGDRVFIVSATDDEVAVKEAAAVSKAVRTLILRVVPGGLQDEAKAIIRKVASDRDAKDPAAAKNRMLDAFAAIGIKPLQLERYLGHGLDTISPAEVDQLRGVYQAIDEGEISWADALAQVEAERDGDQPRPQTSQANSGKPAEPVITPSRAAPASSGAPSRAKGSGTGALKTALGGAPAPPKADVPPGTPPPPPGMEDRACAACGDLVEVPTGSPPGQICAACARQE